MSADTALPGASVSISVAGSKCTALSGANVTDHVLGGCDRLSVGTSATLTIGLSGAARLYIVGFLD